MEFISRRQRPASNVKLGRNEMMIEMTIRYNYPTHVTPCVALHIVLCVASDIDKMI